MSQALFDAVWQPLRLPVVTPESALLAGWFGLRHTAAVMLADQPVALTLSLLRDVPLPEAEQLQLSTRFGMMVWRWPSALWQMLTGVDPGAVPFGQRLILYRLALALLPDDWQVLFGLPQLEELEELGQERDMTVPSAVPRCWWQLEMTGPAGSVRGYLAAAPGVWQAFLVGWHARPRLPPACFRGLSVRIPLRLGQGRLSLAESAQLAVGDLLLLASARFDATGRGRIAAGGLGMYLVWQDDKRQFVFTGWGDASMDDVGDLSVQAPVADRVEAIALDITVELGHLSLMIADLCSLTPGAVLPMNQGGGPPQVSLLCHGQVLGHGQLVTVNDRLAVQILHWPASGLGQGA